MNTDSEKTLRFRFPVLRVCNPDDIRKFRVIVTGLPQAVYIMTEYQVSRVSIRELDLYSSTLLSVEINRTTTPKMFKKILMSEEIGDMTSTINRDSDIINRITCYSRGTR